MLFFPPFAGVDGQGQEKPGVCVCVCPETCLDRVYCVVDACLLALRCAAGFVMKGGGCLARWSLSVVISWVNYWTRVRLPGQLRN